MNNINTMNNNTEINNSPTSPSTNNINIRIATLNCNGLAKVSKPNIRCDMTRFFRESLFNIMCLQETHTSDENIINTLEHQLRTRSAIWTPHCGIVSLNQDIQLHQIETSSLDGRIILAKITHVEQYYKPFYILNIYAPAEDGNVKHLFFPTYPVLIQSYCRI
ncbi:hypothetical protein INT48_000296 [Thamnidium elegans]|uniref:Uncharacterized protein n=1 Tax=Thamnidium elegans TaxID=101142 RepID=A0A8H7SNZ8_9FUNG|nr:hypothetical protein INT48_000296 [Thamnidium elegans]